MGRVRWVRSGGSESLVDLFGTQNSEFFLGTKIIIFLDFDLKFLSFSGCPRKVRNLVSFAGVSKSSRRPIYFRDKYFCVKRTKTITKGQ